MSFHSISKQFYAVSSKAKMYTFIWIEKKRNSKSSDLWKSLSIKQNNVSTGMGNTVSSFNYIFNPLTFKVVKLNLKI